jgi:hypothetical protein
MSNYDDMCHRLIERYPNLFPDGHFPFECGPGWELLIDKALATMVEEGSIPTQIKEKWGELRIYVNSGSDRMFEILEGLEQLSTYTCEECGEYGEAVVRDGWLVTRCKKCYPKRR